MRRDEFDMYDIGNFGWRELELARDLLKAVKNGYPDDFETDHVKLAFNPNSGSVFLTNDEYEVVMERDGELFSWYCLGYHCYEGFLEDLIEQYDNGRMEWEDWEELADICERNGETEKAEEIRETLEMKEAA